MIEHENWSEWFIHDGKGCPVPLGYFEHVIYACGHEFIGVRTGKCNSWTSRYHGPLFTSSWVWAAPGDRVPIIRYRIRRPPSGREDALRGMAILRELVADPPRKLVREGA